MFQTPVAGHFDMRSVSWAGYSNFSNNGTDFLGQFTINEKITEFQANI
jgi:hypothetical protein